MVRGREGRRKGGRKWEGLTKSQTDTEEEEEEGKTVKKERWEGWSEGVRKKENKEEDKCG